MSLTLPLDYQAIERILPHRYPFLLVDRVTEFELDKRIVGIKNISRNEPLLWDDGRGTSALPPTILTEAVAQVGAILILAKPENQNKLIFFGGIERVRYRRYGASRGLGRDRGPRAAPAQPGRRAPGAGPRQRRDGHAGAHDVRPGRPGCGPGAVALTTPES